MSIAINNAFRPSRMEKPGRMEKTAGFRHLSRLAGSSARMLPALGGAAILMLAATFAYDRVSSYRAAVAAAEGDLKDAANAVAEFALATFVGLDKATLHGAREYKRWLAEAAPSESEAHLVLKAIAEGMGAVDALTWVDRNGDRAATSLGFDRDLPRMNLANFAQFTQHRDSADNALRINPPEMGAYTRKMVVTAGRRVEDRAGGFAGVVVGRLNLAYFDDHLARLIAGTARTVALLHANGAFLSRAPDPDAARGRSVGDRPSFGEPAGAAVPTLRWVKSVIDDRSLLIALRRVENYPLMVAVSHPWNAIIAPWWRDTWINGAAWLFACALILFKTVALRRRFEQQEKDRQSLANAQRQAALGSWELDLRTNRLDWSDEIFRLFEIDPRHFGASYEAFLAAIHPDDRAAVDKAYTGSLADRTPYEITHRLLMADGRIKWVQERCETDFDAAGKPLRSRGTVQDVTERTLRRLALEASLREKETLLREVHHRVKNNLQIVSSLLYFQVGKLAHPADAAVFQACRDRLRAMILVHERLYRADNLSRVDFADYLRVLAGELGPALRARARPVDLRIDVEAITLPIEIAQPLGMIVNELLTNAAKHAFPDDRGGEILLRVRVRDGRLALSVKDTGIGRRDGEHANRTGGFGTRLVRNLAGQLGGTVAFAGEAGTEAIVEIPLPGAAAEKAA